MATIGTASHANFTNAPRRSYIAMNAYNQDFFGYSLVFNPTSYSYVGTLSTLNISATSTVQGSILSETGKKLYPTANAGVSTLMVSVFDQTSLQTGFINPNSPTFAIFNTDKPPYMGQGVDPGTDTRSNLGNSIYTHGSVIADGFGTYAGLLSTGTSLTVGTTARVGGSISSGTVVIAPSTFATHMFVNPVNTSAASIGTGTMNGASPSAATVTTSRCNTNSKVFITNTTGTNVIRVNSVNNGSFTTASGNGVTDSFNWLIIN
jgi:hypothetical protein